MWGATALTFKIVQFESLSGLRTDREIFLEYAESLGTK